MKGWTRVGSFAPMMHSYSYRCDRCGKVVSGSAGRASHQAAHDRRTRRECPHVRYTSEQATGICVVCCAPRLVVAQGGNTSSESS